MSVYALLAIVAASAVLGMAGTWWLQRRTRNAGYVDVAWAALLAVAALIYGSFAAGAGIPRLLVAMLAGIWGVRLALHLLSRVLHEAEDGRYQALREHWQGHQGKFFGFFMAQAAPVVGLGPFLLGRGVGQGRLPAVPHVEQVAQHLHRVPLLPFAQQRGHRHAQVLAQQVEQGRLDGSDGVDGGAQVEGLLAAAAGVAAPSAAGSADALRLTMWTSMRSLSLSGDHEALAARSRT
jgi:hypothetical protein